MDSKDVKKLSDLLYCENKEKVRMEVIKMDNSLFLHVIAANYNWDDGFDIPNLIINNKNCDLGTALMIFYNADGYRFLESETNNLSDSDAKWMTFVTDLYSKIQNNDFKTQSISYIPQISKVQMFKLKKGNPTIPSTFLERSPGIEVEVPKL